MRISTEIGGIFTLSLAVFTMACSSRDQNYNAAPVYPAGPDMTAANGSPIPAAAPLVPLSPEEIGPTINYTVKQGDSLWLIAKNHKTTISRLKRVNMLENDKILAGQTLKIPDQAGAVPAAQPNAAPAVGGFRKPSAVAVPPATPKAGSGLKPQN